MSIQLKILRNIVRGQGFLQPVHCTVVLFRRPAWRLMLYKSLQLPLQFVVFLQDGLHADQKVCGIKFLQEA